jgi:hypothetical protein
MTEFTVTLSGEDWWKVLRVLTGEAPANHEIADEISAQLWDRGRSAGEGI